MFGNVKGYITCRVVFVTLAVLSFRGPEEEEVGGLGGFQKGATVVDAAK